MVELNKESPAELTNIDVFEVSLVGSPANRRKFLLAKSEKGGNMGEKDLNENEVGILKRLVAFFKGNKEEVIEIKEVKPEVAEKAIVPAVDVEKAELRKQIEDLNIRMADIKKAQRKGELEAIVKSMIGKPEDNLTYLESLDKHLPADVFKMVIDREQSLEKKIKEGELFKEKGKNQPPEGSATEKINKMVQELVVKGTDKIKAMSDIITAHPDLYELAKKESFRRVDDTTSASSTTETMK